MIKKCLICGKEFITYPSKIKFGRGKYCSKECCLFITNGILEKNGIKTRFQKGGKTWNRKEFIFSQAREDGRKYKLLYKPEHPASTKRGYVREHRLIMEKFLKRYLRKNEIVHHKDGNTLNNNINNLELMSAKEHNSIKEKCL